jgi:hypothetical integral membrane protein (TIGR02206 family)
MFSLEHVLTVVITVAAIAALVAAARLRPGPWTVPAARILALVILVNEASWWVWNWAHGTFSLSYSLPLHLCDVAAFISVLALWLRTPLLVELTYFWGIAGTANGIIEPDVSEHFPAFQFLQYFIQHGAIPAAALFLVVGLKIYPRSWAVVQVFGLTVALVVFDAFANLLTDGNYFYLRQPPGGSNLLELFGAWPRYIFGGVLLAIIFLGLLDLPFKISALARARSKTERYRRPA